MPAEGADVQGMFNRVPTLRRRQPHHVAGRRALAQKAIRWLADGCASTAPPSSRGPGPGRRDARRRPRDRAPRARRARLRRRLRARDAAGRARQDPAGTSIATHAADGHHLPYRDAPSTARSRPFACATLRRCRGDARAAPRGAAGRAVAILEFFVPNARASSSTRCTTATCCRWSAGRSPATAMRTATYPGRVERFCSAERVPGPAHAGGDSRRRGARVCFRRAFASLVTASMNAAAPHEVGHVRRRARARINGVSPRHGASGSVSRALARHAGGAKARDRTLEFVWLSSAGRRGGGNHELGASADYPFTRYGLCATFRAPLRVGFPRAGTPWW